MGVPFADCLLRPTSLCLESSACHGENQAKRKGPPPTRIVTGLLEYTGRPTARLSGKLHGAMIVPSQQEAASPERDRSCRSCWREVARPRLCLKLQLDRPGGSDANRGAATRGDRREFLALQKRRL